MNQIILSGRLTKDPELRQGKTTAFCHFTIALDTGYGDRKKTLFIPCEAVGKTAEFIGKYFSKGDPIEIAGSLMDNSWEKDGVKHPGWKVNVSKAEFTLSRKNKEEAAFSEIDDEEGDLPF